MKWSLVNVVDYAIGQRESMIYYETCDACDVYFDESADIGHIRAAVCLLQPTSLRFIHTNLNMISVNLYENGNCDFLHTHIHDQYASVPISFIPAIILSDAYHDQTRELSIFTNIDLNLSYTLPLQRSTLKG